MNRPGLARRLAAMTYDGLLLAAVVMVAVAVTLPFSGGEAIADHPGVGRSLLQLWILVVAFGFYGGFWTHGGQTLGMKAWRMRVARRDGRALRWRDAALRFACAIPSIGLVGLGLWWMVFDPDHLALHDRLSRTVLVRTE
jgi:uncharacterized RDD family membrane protein YckC